MSFSKFSELFKNSEKLKKAVKEVEKWDREHNIVHARPLFYRIEKEWLEKGISDGAISSVNGEYQPKGYESEKDEVIGYRGREPIIEKKIKLNFHKYADFCKRYEDFKDRKERQQFAVNEEMNSLIKDTDQFNP